MDTHDVLGLWGTLSGRPGGKWLFSRVLGLFVPYTGTLRARIEEVGPRRTVVRLEDRRRVRNHLRSVHAMALANLAEVASGLALLSGLPEDARGIVRGFTIEYLKKARGPLTATASCTPPGSSESREIEVQAEILDASGDVVARASARWAVGPKGPAV